MTLPIISRRSRKPLMAVMAAVSLPAPALAHSGHDMPGWPVLSWLLHPLSGIDHISFAVFAGLLCALTGTSRVRTAMITVAAAIAGPILLEGHAQPWGLALVFVLMLALTASLQRRFRTRFPFRARDRFPSKSDAAI